MLKLNPLRKKEFLDLMAQRGWDLLLFYGDTWRKDHFRCLVSVCFCGPQAVAVLTKEGEVRAVVTHPWDVEPVKTATGGSVAYVPRLVEGLKNCVSKSANVAINGLEQMEARFVRAVQEQPGRPPHRQLPTWRKSGVSKHRKSWSGSGRPHCWPTAVMSNLCVWPGRE